MSEYFDTSHNEISPRLQGSLLRGIIGSIVGMLVCILASLLFLLCQMESFSIMLQLFAGLVIGWFYRLFRGRRAKTAAFVTVGICTILTSVLWTVSLVLLVSAAVSPARLTKPDWDKLGSAIRTLLLLCSGLGLAGFFLTRRNLLAYADWKKGPWHIAYANAGGALYNLLPENLPVRTPPTCFAVHGRFTPGSRITVEGSSLRWTRRFRKDRLFFAHDIAGVVLGPSNGCNVLYDNNYQVLVKFAGSMEHADLLFLWLLQQNIPMDRTPAAWSSPIEAGPGPQRSDPSVPQRQFILRLKRTTRIGFTGIGWFLLLLGAALFLAIDFSALAMTERWAIALLELAVLGMGIIYLRIQRVCRVEIDGEQIRAVSRFGRTAEFSVKDVSSVSKSMGWIVLYDREWKTLAKLDSCLEHLDMLKEYFAFYGVKW